MITATMRAAMAACLVAVAPGLASAGPHHLASDGPVVAALGPACGKGDKSYVGRYELRGVMEVGSQLVLRADGSFTFSLAYGANDQAGSGCWTQTDRLIALFPDGEGARISGTHTPDTRGFTGMVLYKEGRDLVWRIPGSNMVGRYRRY